MFEKMNHNPCFTLYTKTNLGRIIGLNVRAKLKFLKENSGEYLSNFGVAKDLLEKNTKCIIIV